MHNVTSHWAVISDITKVGPQIPKGIVAVIKFFDNLEKKFRKIRCISFAFVAHTAEHNNVIEERLHNFNVIALSFPLSFILLSSVLESL
jgi:uncharacterized protein (DUF934 family)